MIAMFEENFLCFQKLFEYMVMLQIPSESLMMGSNLNFNLKL